MARPGKTASHQAKGVRLASANIAPQLASSAAIPTPKKDKVASISIAAAILNARATAKVGNAFGRICFQRICILFKPITLADSMYVECLIFKVSALAKRAIFAQLLIPMINTTE